MTFFVTRLILDEYSNIFFCDDLLHRLLYYFFTLGVFIMCFNSHPHFSYADENYSNSYNTISRNLASTTCGYNIVHSCNISERFMSGFYVGFVITRIALFFIILSVVITLPSSREQFIYILGIQLFSGLFVVSSLCFSDILQAGDQNKLIVVAVVIEIAGRMLEPEMSKLLFRKNMKEIIFYPIDIYSFQHRMGVFIMMIIGESFIVMLTKSPSDANMYRSYFFVLCGMNLLFFLSMQVPFCELLIHISILHRSFLTYMLIIILISSFTTLSRDLRSLALLML